MSIICIEEANIEHAKIIWELRNEKITRLMSKNNDYIKWQTHLVWFTKAIKDLNTFFYIGKIGDKIMGSVRFVKHENSLDDYFVNINISPDSRGKGLSKILLKSSINKFSSEVNKVRFIKAEVKEINDVSKNLFKNYGFKKENLTKNEIITFKLCIDKN